MIARALDAGVPSGWVTGDEVYGGDPGLRADLERRRVGYVLAVAVTHRVATARGRLPGPPDRRPASPAGVAAGVRTGEGAKGHRYYDSAWMPSTPAGPVTAGC